MGCSDAQVTYAAFVVFGISSWVTVNGIFAQLPTLAQELPEGWALPSYLSVTIQLANVGPVAYLMLRRRERGSPSAASAVTAIVCCGLVSMLLLALAWRSTAKVLGAPRSWALLLFTFTAATADCTSSVVYWPFVGGYHARYISALAVGEGMSGVAAALSAWAVEQLGLGPSAYFGCLALLLGCSLVAFWVLRHVQACQTQRQVGREGEVGGEPIREDNWRLLGEEGAASLEMSKLEPAHVPGVEKRQHAAAAAAGWRADASDPPPAPWMMLALIGWCSAWQNGVIQSTLSFAAGPKHCNLQQAACLRACVPTAGVEGWAASH
jgi:hypothetical protein